MIYLDNNATTQPDPEVVRVMMQYLSGSFGNPASQHYTHAVEARSAVEEAAGSISEHLGAQRDEIVFTSGATEAVNLALKGAFASYKGKGRHLITVETEHKAVLDTVAHLERLGTSVTRLRVHPDGLIDLQQLEEAFTPDTFLVSIMWVNNETGVIQPMEEIAELCRLRGALFFTDATQAVGKMPIDVGSLPVSMMAFSAHKFHGPKGIGGLYVRGSKPKLHLTPLIHGGGHQGGMRSGTLPVPGIMGMAKALELALQHLDKERTELKELRARIESGLLDLYPGAHVNGSRTHRIHQTTNVCFPGIRSEDLIREMREEVAFSAGSACTAAEPEPSHVLQAMGLDVYGAAASFRLSFGRMNRGTEAEAVLDAFQAGLERVSGK